MEAKARDFAANGLFHYQGIIDSENPRQGPKMSASWVSSHDGVSTTLLIAENLNAGHWPDVLEFNVGMVWTDKYSLALNRPDDDAKAYQINTTKGDAKPASLLVGTGANPFQLARPSSWHPGGVVASFADGHQKFISEDIPYATFVQLMTTWGSYSTSPINDSTLVDHADPGVQARRVILNDADY